MDLHRTKRIKLNSKLSLVEPNRVLLKTDEEINRTTKKIGTDKSNI